MGRNGRFFGVLVVSTVAAAFTFLWRNKRARQRVQAIFAPAGDHIRDVIRRINRLRHAVATADQVPPQRPTITGFSAPECRPLTTVDEFLAWTPSADPDTPFCQTYNSPLLLPPPAGAPARATPAAAPATAGAAAAPAVAPGAGAGGSSAGASSGRSSGASSSSGCRLLVCHDMMGGYLADRYVQGAGEQGFFRLWQWDQIDLFIYFSHHLITVPPPAWTAAAHRNGVRVLGTFITEWEEGRARCTRLFASRATARAAADRLVALAQHHGFEGWLINVENGLDRELVPHLQHFVAHLRARMAAEVPHGLVIWYDAITVEGRLAWQDGLTPRNAPFFDAADALFVNYKWQEGAPAAVAAAAGSRAADVFMGVDVFGRGSYGGGQDNCHVALGAARAGGVSAALFAPGWVYEEFDRSTFEPRQEAFWGKIREVWPARSVLVQRLPLVSCFNTGAGRGQWVGGRRVSVAPWWNLAAQDAVPTLTPLGGGGGGGGQQAGPSAGASLSVRPTTQVAFSGGSCLAFAVTPTTATTAVASSSSSSSSSSATTRRLGPNGPWVHGLYGTHLPVPHGGLELSYTVACTGSSRVALLLHFAREGQEGAGAAAAGAGAEAACGVAVGPWTAGDRATVEALRAAGFSCVCCTAAPSGATTSPLPELPLTSASLAPAPTSSSSSTSTTASIPSGIPWLNCTACLPRAVLPVAASGSGAVVCAVSVVCYVAGGPAAAGGQLGGSAAAAAAAVGRSVAAALGQGSSASSYLAFLGCLVLREHLPAPPATQHLASSLSSVPATTAAPPQQPGSIHLPPTTSGPASGPAASAAPAVGPLGIPLTAPLPLAPPPGRLLTEARCSRVRWTRPGRSSPPPPPTDAAVAAGIAAAVAAASGPGEPSTAGLDSEDSWERSSAPAASPAAAAATGLHEPPVVLSGSDVADDEDEVEVQLGGGGTSAGSISGGNGGGAATARLLTCEISWAPQFDDGGMPVHRSYHVWVHFNVNGGNGGAGAAAAVTAGGPASPALGTPGRGRGVTGTPSSPGPAGGWEVLQLQPDWAEGAVWVGEAFVARYRLVDLEVPVWASSVTLLVQGVGAACGQLQPLQALATLPAPAAV